MCHHPNGVALEHLFCQFFVEKRAKILLVSRMRMDLSVFTLHRLCFAKFFTAVEQ